MVHTTGYSNDFWHTDDESDTNSVIAPSDISYISEYDADDGSKLQRDDDTFEVSEPLCLCSSIEPEIDNISVDDIHTEKYTQLPGSINSESVSPCGLL